ncbi:MAG TPA: BadF/BadG/BcrA/BcrD ATPase family protein [Candidatus Rubrimentiphilum sp.]|nr:BadF/BadG/BcrA/BcrD ATPase family protein [Candidatus Rubrimentiphilum sp.]
MSRIAVGVDAGGSKTAVTYSVDGDCKGVWYGGSANATVHGAERAGDSIARTIELALDGALPGAVFVGAAGAGREDVARELKGALESRFAGATVEVRDDAFIALRAAVPEGDGTVVIGGTGAIAYAEKNGTGFRSGGYGYLFGDGGSGFGIGAAAVDHLLRAYDGRAPRDAFVQEVEAALEVRSLSETLQKVYTAQAPARVLAALAPIVVESAGRGDRSASKIVQQAAAELNSLVKAAISSAGLTGSHAPIAFSGGLLSARSLLTFLLETRLLNDFPEMPIRKDNPAPAAGALHAAERLL